MSVNGVMRHILRAGLFFSPFLVSFAATLPGTRPGVPGATRYEATPIVSGMARALLGVGDDPVPAGSEPWVWPAFLLLGFAVALVVIVEASSRKGGGYVPRNPRRFRVLETGSGSSRSAPSVRPVTVEAREAPRAVPAATPLRPAPPPAPAPRIMMKPGYPAVNAVVSPGGFRIRLVDTGFCLEGPVSRAGDRLKYRWEDLEGIHEDSVDFTPNRKTGGHFIYTGRRASRVQIVAVTKGA